MPEERVRALPSAHIPNTHRAVTGTGTEHVLVVGAEGQAHHVCSVVCELHLSGVAIDVPQHASGISGRGQNLIRGQESTAGQVTFMACQFVGGFTQGGAWR